MNARSATTRARSFKKFTASFMVCGRPLEMRFTVPNAPARLCDIIPLARKLTDAITQRVIDQATQDGLHIPCKSGCSACCNYLVPLSPPELLRLDEDIANRPASQLHKNLYARFGNAMQRIVHAGAPPTEGIISVSKWYAELELSCPLLESDLCSMYAERPMSCRQHVVCSEPVHCEGADPDQGQILEMPVNTSKALAFLAEELTGKPAQAVMLPLAPHWLDTNLDSGKATYPPRLMAKKFARIVREMLSTASREPLARSA